jgi:hypothetical protein
MPPTCQVMMIRQQFWLLNFFDIFSPLEKGGQLCVSSPDG